MIKLEHVVLPSPEQMEFIIEGMRNPMNSWDKSDSHCTNYIFGCDNEHPRIEKAHEVFYLGNNDNSLMQRLAKNGPVHRKYMRMMQVGVRITAPLYWWKEFDTYKIGTVTNSCSTMHKIHEKEFTLEDFSCEHLYNNTEKNEFFKDHLLDTIDGLNQARYLYLECGKVLKSNVSYGLDPVSFRKEIEEKQKKYWYQMIQLLPSSYNQTRNVMMNYEVLANIYESRENHKLNEWCELCKWIKTLPYSDLITGRMVKTDVK